MVVIAMMAILAAMLLPALSKARETAQTINCSSMQKQFGTILTLYADSCKEWGIGDPYPKYLVSPTTGTHFWKFFDKSSPYCVIGMFHEKNRSKYIACTTAVNVGKQSSANGDGTCGINSKLGEKYDRGVYDWQNQGTILGSNTNASFFKPSTVKQPAALHWLKCGIYFSNSSFHFWHNGSTTMLFVDGSVQKLRKADIAPNAGRFLEVWCYYPSSGSCGRTYF